MCKNIFKVCALLRGELYWDAKCSEALPAKCKPNQLWGFSFINGGFHFSCPLKLFLNLKLKIVFFKELGKISVFLSHHPSHFTVCTKSYSPQKHFHITHCTKKNGMLDSILFRIKYIFVPDSEWKLKGSPHSKESKQSQGEWGEQV